MTTTQNNQNASPATQGQTLAHKIASFTISTKKGDAQPLRFLIGQEHPYPDISCDGGRLKWRNAGGLFAQYPATTPAGIGARYYCHLLPPGNATPPANYDRTHFASYNGNANALSFRGKELGEVQIKFTPGAPGSPLYADITVRGFERPTVTEREMIDALIVPQLWAFIHMNRAALFADAKAKVAATFARQISETRAELETLEQEAAQAMAQIKGGAL